jgi:rare lipoprotein A
VGVSSALLSLLGAILTLSACHHATSLDGKDQQFVDATWYDVPLHSLAHERAARGEMTAASNLFGRGTRVRVTRVSNGKSVVVRITDTVSGKENSGIDLCREAAAKLAMVSDGVAQVKVETVR